MVEMIRRLYHKSVREIASYQARFAANIACTVSASSAMR